MGLGVGGSVSLEDRLGSFQVPTGAPSPQPPSPPASSLKWRLWVPALQPLALSSG